MTMKHIREKTENPFFSTPNSRINACISFNRQKSKLNRNFMKIKNLVDELRNLGDSLQRGVIHLKGKRKRKFSKKVPTKHINLHDLLKQFDDLVYTNTPLGRVNTLLNNHQTLNTSTESHSDGLVRMDEISIDDIHSMPKDLSLDQIIKYFYDLKDKWLYSSKTSQYIESLLHQTNEIYGQNADIDKVASDIRANTVDVFLNTGANLTINSSDFQTFFEKLKKYLMNLLPDDEVTRCILQAKYDELNALQSQQQQQQKRSKCTT